MRRLLRQRHGMSISSSRHMLARNIQVEGDLIEQLFNSSEKRLARALLLRARYGGQDRPTRLVPKISKDSLAEKVGTTRARVSFLLTRFKKQGFIEFDGQIPTAVHSSLLNVVLHD